MTTVGFIGALHSFSNSSTLTVVFDPINVFPLLYFSRKDPLHSFPYNFSHKHVFYLNVSFSFYRLCLFIFIYFPSISFLLLLFLINLTDLSLVYIILQSFFLSFSFK